MEGRAFAVFGIGFTSTTVLEELTNSTFSAPVVREGGGREREREREREGGRERVIKHA